MASLADWGSKRENPKQHSLCLTEPVLRRDILRGPDLLGAFVVSPLLLSYCWKNPIPVSICPMSQISGSVSGSVMVSRETRDTIFITPFLPSVTTRGFYVLRISLGMNFLDVVRAAAFACSFEDVPCTFG